jgi:hypothetical protein
MVTTLASDTTRSGAPAGVWAWATAVEARVARTAALRRAPRALVARVVETNVIF